MFVDLMKDIRKQVASLTYRATIEVPRQQRPTMPPPQKLVLSGPSDTPDTSPAHGAMEQPREVEVEEQPRDAIAAAMAGGRRVPVGAAAATDVRRLQTNRGDGAAAKQTPVTAAPTVGRNDPCPCGSGKKYKKCHGA